MVRNLYGYLQNYFEEDPAKRSQLQFEAGKLTATWLQYDAYIKGAAIFIVAFTTGTALAPYAYYMAGTVAFILDLVRKAFKDAASPAQPVT